MPPIKKQEKIRLDSINHVVATLLEFRRYLGFIFSGKWCRSLCPEIVVRNK